jgi:hypothetical protein
VRPSARALSARGRTWAVGIPRIRKGFPADVEPIFPRGRGRARKRHLPDQLSRAAEGMPADADWQAASWRAGTRGRLAARFAAMRVRVADGPVQRIGEGGNQHLPGEEAWLLGEPPMSGEKKYHLSNLPADTELKTPASAIKARWSCEQAHQPMKEERGLDPFEGRSWAGLHRHALMTLIACAFLQSRRLAEPGRGKRAHAPPPQPSLPAVRHAIATALMQPHPPPRCPHRRRWISKPPPEHRVLK